MESICKNAEWELIKLDDGQLMLISTDQSIRINPTKKQLLALPAIVEAAANA
jgi:hypothetical protein